jgi:hypothetical protein
VQIKSCAQSADHNSCRKQPWDDPVWWPQVCLHMAALGQSLANRSFIPVNGQLEKSYIMIKSSYAPTKTEGFGFMLASILPAAGPLRLKGAFIQDRPRPALPMEPNRPRAPGSRKRGRRTGPLWRGLLGALRSAWQLELSAIAKNPEQIQNRIPFHRDRLDPDRVHQPSQCDGCHGVARRAKPGNASAKVAPP